MSAPDRHNAFVKRVMKEMAAEAHYSATELNVMAESLLLGVGMFNFPDDPRRQALMIQSIADGAQDRARSVAS